MTAEVQCPCCGEPTDVFVDPGGGAQQVFIEDCVVCCRPIQCVAVREGDDDEYDVAVSPA